MEANFFRALARETESVVRLRRIEKIFAPADDTWTFRLDNRHDLRFLLFRPARSAGLFFFTDQKPVNPMQPPARVMWYRKRVVGRRILAQFVDWPGLRIAWELTPRKESGHGRYLILSLRDDLSLADELDEGFAAEPAWPELARVLDSGKDDELWRTFPHLSPPLRRVLKHSPVRDAGELYDALQADAASTFHLGNKPESFPLPWPVSESDASFDSALAAATAHGEKTLFPLLEHQDLSPERARLKRARKKIRRALARLEEEQQELDRRRALKSHAEALQAEIYRLKDLEDVHQVTAMHPELGELAIALDPKLSIVENMERMFKLAAKADRGYVHLARRRNELGKEMARLEAGTAQLAEPRLKAEPTGEGAPALPRRYQGIAVSLYTSTDNMLILRGKNKKANHQILSKLASPFDWWFHAAHGPSSHVILKRDHPNQEVPERTLLEAAGLCALKSHYKDAGRAEVMFALVKDVRKVKGWAHGRVAVDQVLGTVLVDIEDGLEERISRS